MLDVKDVAKVTPREDELFEYINAPDYYKERVKDYTIENEKNEYDLSR